jgi:DNA modification methylase
MAENHKQKPPPIRYGLDNPHPLSQIKTELVWDGKYDEYGNRRAVDIAGCAMPLQKIETIDEPRSRAAASGNLELFEKEKKRRDDFRNRLIWGDNKLVMASLLAEFKGGIDLIYIDPPFDVGADFTMDVPIGDEKETVFKDQSCIEMVAFKDMWGKDTNSYLHMMFERLILMKELLRDTGSIFVHCDWRVNHFLHAMLEEVFNGNIRNEIIWCYTGPGSPGMSQYSRKHDNIYWYSVKNKGFKFYEAQIRVAHDEKTQANFKAGLRGSGFIGDNYDLPEGKIPEDWWEMAIAARYPVDGVTRTGYATEKPWPLVERIIKTCTEEGDIVADVFGGGGTTAAVAERLGRQWIICDLGRFAIHTSRKRLIELQRALNYEGKPYRAFDVYNLGRYERQWWQKERLKGADQEHRKVVLGFYKAEALRNAGAYLHGRKGRAFVHVSGIDSILTRDEVRGVATAAHEAGAKEVHCLAWEFEMDLRLICHELEASEGVQIKLIPIPREIMEKNRTSPPPFLEVAVLEAEPVYRKVKGGANVDIKLTRFLPSLAEVPSKELEALKERAVKSGFDFIDFWAVDFNWHDGKPFEHHWQDYRTRQDRSLKTVSDAGFDKYPKPGKYTACVKVVDVFGCDTSITVEVKV